MNSIGSILQDINKSDNQFQQQLDLINKYMNRNHINEELQFRVRQYLSYIMKIENIHNITEEYRSIEQLNPQLKEELIIQTNGKIVNDCSIFVENFSEQTLRKLVVSLKQNRFIPGDFIFQVDSSDDNLYFIEKGTIQLFLPQHEFYEAEFPENYIIKLQNLTARQSFGYDSFFTSFNRNHGARSLDFSTVFSISRKDFLNILKNNNDDLQKFQMIKDKIILYNDFSPFKTHCAACFSKNHSLLECNFCHFVADSEKIIKTYNFPYIQQRQKYDRRPSKSLNALIINEEINLISKYYFISEDENDFIQNNDKQEEGGKKKLEGDQTQRPSKIMEDIKEEINEENSQSSESNCSISNISNQMNDKNIDLKRMKTKIDKKFSSSVYNFIPKESLDKKKLYVKQNSNILKKQSFQSTSNVLLNMLLVNDQNNQNEVVSQKSQQDQQQQLPNKLQKKKTIEIDNMQQNDLIQLLKLQPNHKYQRKSNEIQRNSIEIQKYSNEKRQFHFIEENKNLDIQFQDLKSKGKFFCIDSGNKSRKNSLIETELEKRQLSCRQYNNNNQNNEIQKQQSNFFKRSATQYIDNLAKNSQQKYYENHQNLTDNQKYQQFQDNQNYNLQNNYNNIQLNNSQSNNQYFNNFNFSNSNMNQYKKSQSQQILSIQNSYQNTPQINYNYINNNVQQMNQQSQINDNQIIDQINQLVQYNNYFPHNNIDNVLNDYYRCNHISKQSDFTKNVKEYYERLNYAYFEYQFRKKNQNQDVVQRLSNMNLQQTKVVHQKGQIQLKRRSDENQVDIDKQAIKKMLLGVKSREKSSSQKKQLINQSSIVEI